MNLQYSDYDEDVQFNVVGADMTVSELMALADAQPVDKYDPTSAPELYIGHRISLYASDDDYDVVLIDNYNRKSKHHRLRHTDDEHEPHRYMHGCDVM